MGAAPEPLSERATPLPAVGSAALLAVVYTAAGCVGLFALGAANGPSVFWPASGVALGWLLRFGTKAWPGVFVGAIVVSELVGRTFPLAVIIAAGNAAGAALGVCVVRRVAGPWPLLQHRRGVTALLLGAVVGAVPSAVIGPLMRYWDGVLAVPELGLSVFVWWLGDMAGVVLVAPVVVTRLRPAGALPKFALAVFGLAAVAVIALAVALAQTDRRLAVTGPCLAVMVAAAVRFGPRGVAAANLLTAAVGIIAVHGGAPHPQSLAAFLVVVSATALYLGAVLAERDADLAARVRAESELARREGLLQAVSAAAAKLLAGPTTAETLPPVLALLGGAAGVHRAYVMSFHPAGDDVLAKLVHEWHAAPAIPQAHDMGAGPVPVRGAGFGRWLDLLGRGDAIHGPVETMPASERPFLAGQRIRSLLVAPIDAGELWGAVGFEDCATDRAWSAAEVDAVRAAAAALGGAIRRERIEAQSRAVQERFRALLGHSHDVTAVLSAGGVVQFISDAAERIAGHKPEHLRGRNAFEFTHPDDLPLVRVALADCLAHPEEPIRSEFRFRTAGGGWVWLEAIGTNLLHNPAVGGIVLNARDVTERRLAEGELLRARELLESTGRMARIGGWEYRIPEDRLVWSEQTYRIHEVDPVSFAPTMSTAIEFYAPEGRPVIAAAVERGMATGEPWNLVLPLDTARRRRLWVNALGQVEFRDGKPYRLYGTFQDVTDRVEGERALTRSEARYRNLFENAPVAIWEEDFTGVGEWFAELRAAGVTDLAAHLTANPDAVLAAVARVRVTDVNRAGVDLNGATDKDHLAANLARLFTPAAQATFAEELAALWGGARHIRLETRALKLSGGEVDVVMHLHVPEIDGREDLTKVVLIAFDVTEQKRLEQQFRQAAKLEAVGRLAGGIAHDFNNLLTVINGFSEMLQHQYAAGTPTGELVGQIRDAGARAAGLTRQLLAFSRRQSVPTTAVDLRALVNGLRPLLAPLVGEGIRVVIDPGPQPPPVRADHGQIEQVVMNLCVNARDAMPDGGTLTLSAGFIDLSDGPADDVPAGRYVVLSVADTGEGIPEDVRPHIFDPFFTTKELGKGTGLGLSTVYGIVSQAGGHVRFDSAVGAGTTFRVYFPATDDPLAVRAAADAVPAVAPGRVVLLVEDEPAVRQLSEAVLLEDGFEVLAAEGGPAALALLAKSPRGIDLLVTDVAMPGMNGRVLANRLKEAYPRLLVVFVSGYTPEEIETGPGEVFLPKPFGPDDLTRVVHGLLAVRS